MSKPKDVRVDVRTDFLGEPFRIHDFYVTGLYRVNLKRGGVGLFGWLSRQGGLAIRIYPSRKKQQFPHDYAGEPDYVMYLSAEPRAARERRARREREVGHDSSVQAPAPQAPPPPEDGSE